MARRRSLPVLMRSRRLAVAEIAFLAAYSAVGTAVPVDGPVPRALDALGFDHPFSHPLFLGVLALLAVSTAACAWERTRAAVGTMRSSGEVRPSTVSRLEAIPPIPVASPLTALEAAEERLRALRLRVRRGPRMLEARAGLWGLWGSPVFHWSLVALIVVLAFGRLTRAEGQLGVLVGGARADVASSYGLREEGTWHRTSSEVMFQVPEFDPAYVDERGIDVGPAPVVRVVRDGVAIAEGRTYPNRPLRAGALMVHSTSDYGLSAWVSLLAEDGSVVDTLQTITDFDIEQPTGTATTEFDVGPNVTVSISPKAREHREDGERYLVHALPEDPLLVVKSRAEGVVAATVELRRGETSDIGQGYRLRFDDLTYYARLSIAEDWSVAPMYVLFAVAALALTVAALAPYRSVRVMLARDGSGVHAEWRHARVDPVFDERVREALGTLAPAQGAAAESRCTEDEEAT